MFVIGLIPTVFVFSISTLLRQEPNVWACPLPWHVHFIVIICHLAKVLFALLLFYSSLQHLRSICMVQNFRLVFWHLKKPVPWHTISSAACIIQPLLQASTKNPILTQFRKNLTFDLFKENIYFHGFLSITASSFISSFEYWDERGGLHCLLHQTGKWVASAQFQLHFTQSPTAQSSLSTVRFTSVLPFPHMASHQIHSVYNEWRTAL